MMENTGPYFNLFKGDQSKLLDLSDGTLYTADGSVFQIHKFVLARSSEYFYATFCGAGTGRKDVLIPGVRGEVLNYILAYIYTGNAHVTEENLCDVIVTADYLLLRDLLSQITKVLGTYLCVGNSLGILSAAVKINNIDIMRESFRFVQTNFEDMVLCSSIAEFCELPIEALRQLLSDRNLRVSSENIVWTAIVKWVQASLSNRLKFVPELLMYLATADVDEQLGRTIVEHELVAGNNFCKAICEIKSSNSELREDQVLLNYVLTNPSPVMRVYTHRSPVKLNFIAFHHQCFSGFDKIQIYVTYDAKLDLWREVLKFDLVPRHLLSIDSCIYLFDTQLNTHHRFNVIDKRWLPFTEFSIPRLHYAVVKLQRLVYVLGGFSTILQREIYNVEVYAPEEDVWRETRPMHQVKSFEAVILQGSIYVVGNEVSAFSEMVAQVYDPSTEMWNLLPEPSIFRTGFALVAYHEKMYLIGGSHLSHVEVFDPTNSVWRSGKNLPYVYDRPKAVVLEDRLIVYDNIENTSRLNKNPPVLWNVGRECWEIAAGCFSKIDLHLYSFFSLEDTDYVNAVSNENKAPDTVFEKSPFL